MSLETSLATVEKLVDQISDALLAADPPTLEKLTTALRDAMAQLSYEREREGRGGAASVPAVLQQRLDNVGRKLALHRESLARLSALTERQAAALLPPSEGASTYGDGLGARPRGAGAARIYRSAG